MLPFETENSSVLIFHRILALSAAGLLLAWSVVSLTFKTPNITSLVSHAISAIGVASKQCSFWFSLLWQNSCKMQNCWSSAPAFSLIKALSQWSSLEETYTKTIQKLVWFVILSNVISLCINGNFTVIFSLPFFFLSSFLFSSLYRKRNCINVKTKWERKWQKLMVKTKLQKNWYWCGKKTCIYETLALPLCVGRFCASNFESLNI